MNFNSNMDFNGRMSMARSSQPSSTGRKQQEPDDAFMMVPNPFLSEQIESLYHSARLRFTDYTVK
jgi:hypothetical protein